jgi:undecaprenyl-diphosphatase
MLQRRHFSYLGARTFGASRWLLARERRWLLLLAAALAALGTFGELSEDLIEDDELLAFDTALLRAVAEHRQAWLTIHAIDLTALGSVTVLTLAGLVAGVPLLRIRDHHGALQLLLAMLGVALWTYLTKNLFSRERPELVYRLLEVQGYSFPSGHSSGSATLYVTLALVLRRHVRSLGSRTLLFAGCGGLALAIGLSRVYLGVHYPSDVASGLAFGSGWALLLAAAFEWRLHARAESSSQRASYRRRERDLQRVSGACASGNIEPRTNEQGAAGVGSAVLPSRLNELDDLERE